MFTSLLCKMLNIHGPIQSMFPMGHISDIKELQTVNTKTIVFIRKKAVQTNLAHCEKNPENSKVTGRFHTWQQQLPSTHSDN